MILRRSPHRPEPYEQRSSDFHVSGDRGEAYLDFRDYGQGDERTSYLQIVAQWEDVQGLIESFAKASHPQAMRLQRAHQLAAAVEAIAKS
jgi:hypothetical protein